MDSPPPENGGRPCTPLRLLRARAARLRRRGDRGDFSAQYILLAALAISVAVAISAILTELFISAAESLDLGLNQ
ncbi:hypothetical protein [Streptomonospora salina]|uniref:Uncharacterized protein n=1 Tax=Streptomonospora salina TaxID=104205 RepID=A0A841ECH7_9ACTN|nr:hypothetical protein [Streptomonospora salina]MBB6000104.1 hypothetical protein [Streptomonospora salina]